MVGPVATKTKKRSTALNPATEGHKTAKGPAKKGPAAKRKTGERKSLQTRVSAAKFLNAIDHPTRRKDAKALAKLFAAISGEKARMWGPTIVGFGAYHYVYDSGREGDSPRIGFSPRSQSLVIYIMPGFEGSAGLLAKLGKHKIGKSCLYVNKLEDVDLPVLERLVRGSWHEMQKRYPA